MYDKDVGMPANVPKYMWLVRVFGFVRQSHNSGKALDLVAYPRQIITP